MSANSYRMPAQPEGSGKLRVFTENYLAAMNRLTGSEIS